MHGIFVGFRGFSAQNARGKKDSLTDVLAAIISAPPRKGITRRGESRGADERGAAERLFPVPRGTTKNAPRNVSVSQIGRAHV